MRLAPSSDAFARLASDGARSPVRRVQIVTDASRQLFVNFWASEPRFGLPPSNEKAL
jgi:hypothetical protein